MTPRPTPASNVQPMAYKRGKMAFYATAEPRISAGQFEQFSRAANSFRVSLLLSAAIANLNVIACIQAKRRLGPHPKPLE
jgi:hypothetical protein